MRRRLEHTKSLPEEEEGKYFVYGLRCPRTGALRYIGATCNPRERHVTHCLRGCLVSLRDWVWSLLDEDDFPRMQILRRNVSIDDIGEAEAELIAKYAKMFPGSLLNRSDNPAYRRSDRPMRRKREPRPPRTVRLVLMLLQEDWDGIKEASELSYAASATDWVRTTAVRAAKRKLCKQANRSQP